MPSAARPSSPHPAMSISSLLSSTQCDNHESPPLSPTTSPRHSFASSDTSAIPLTPVSHSHSLFGDPSAKAAYHIRDLMASPLQATPTRIRCFHAAVAQKSYGTEKRFMCPPPIVRAIGDGRPSSLGVSLAVECDQGPGLEQHGQLEASCATFRYLHVGGTNKAKSCHLRLGVLGESAQSTPISIISKPSKKSLKSRSPHSCIASGATVALYTRINSQTVRTNYLSASNATLTVAKAQWSPFTITLINEAPGAIIHYGSIITLTDLDSGLATEALEVCRVDRGSIVEASGPISQLQKVALRRPNSMSFLSSTLANQTAHQNKRLSSRLTFTEPQAIDDREIWTLVGISMFETSLPQPAGPLDRIHTLDILPTLATPPTLDPSSARLTIPLRHGFPNPQIWLGWLGPLPTHQTNSGLVVSLPDPIVAIQQMGWCSTPTPCSPHHNVMAYRFPLLAVDPSGFLFNLGPVIEVQVSRPNPIYTQALYTWLI
ncbi:hypothetical protein DSO57_1023999 [Entomophthora muscae]|uniref:Uncharacterized protein n=1 Tax=Entomophthora muscae TaxID=34485 RepID=A0ACC2SFM3_9FUNG|nr:hypothetical protein DSO57_1023999 [Entomophthora muscae]